MGFIDNFLKGRAMAEQEHEGAQQRQRQQEDRKIQLEELDIRRKQLKLLQKKEQLGLMEGQPGKEVGVGAALQQQAAIPETLDGQMGAVPGMENRGGNPNRTVDLPLPGVEFGKEEGFDSPFTVRPQSLQEGLRKQMGMKAFESSLKQEENTLTLPPIPSLGINEPIQVDKSIADNLLTQAGSNVRQGDQQKFTADENEKRLQQDSDQAKLDRESREKIASESRIAAGIRAMQSGKQSRTVQQAISMANQFDQNAITKNYAVVREGADFARSLKGGTSSDDIGLLYAFAKAMDPGSVVREGEYATVQKYAQSWAQQFGFKVERIFSNSPFLTGEAKRNMIATIGSKEQAAKRSYENLRKEAGKKFSNIGETPEEWLANYETGAAPAAGGGGSANPYR